MYLLPSFKAIIKRQLFKEWFENIIQASVFCHNRTYVTSYYIRRKTTVEIYFEEQSPKRKRDQKENIKRQCNVETATIGRAREN